MTVTGRPPAPSDRPPAKPSLSKWITPVLGLAMMVSFGSSYYLLGVLAEPMAKGLGTQTVLAFWALSAAFLISALLTGVAGRWIDRRGGREVLLAAAGIFTLSLLVMACAVHPLMMMGGIAMLGVGMGVGFYGPANALLVAIHGEGAKRHITAVSLIGAFGGAIGWPLTAFVTEAWGWRMACVMWAVGHAAVCVPLFLTLLPSAKQVAPTGGTGKLAGRVRWDGTLCRLAVLFACAWWVATAMAAHLPRVLERLGLTVAEAATVAGTMAVAAIGVRLAALIWPLMSAPTATLRMATLAHPVGAVLALVFGRWAGLALALGQGMGNGLLSVAAGVLPLHFYGRENYAQRQALMVMPARFAQAAAPMMFAAIMDISHVAGLVVTTGLCLVMFCMTLGLGEPVRSAGKVATA